tara:strand:- start:183302 stop:183724 length:423 start_codon:yes stop_codon:yes gene_type:complete
MSKLTTKFKPGESGNPDGRPPGSKNKSTLLLERLGDDIDALLNATKRKAMKGDMQAMKILLDRALPVRRPTLPTISVPGLQEAMTLTEKGQAVLNAIGNSEIPPDVGASLLNALGNVSRLVEVDELLKRVEKLEAAHEAN